MTLGQEFHGFATTLGEDHSGSPRTRTCCARSTWARPRSAPASRRTPATRRPCSRHLREITGLDLVTADRPRRGDQRHRRRSCRSPSTLKRNAIKLSKICNDLRLLSSGPQAGSRRDQPARASGGLQHHAGQGQPGDPRGRQPGRVRGRRRRHDGDDGRRGRAAAAERVRAGHRALDLPVDHLDAARHAHAAGQLRRRHHREPRAPRAPWSGSSVGVVTALTPFIGYAAAAALAKTALLTGRNVADLVVEAGLMSREEVVKQLSPARLSGLETITAAIPIMQADDSGDSEPAERAGVSRVADTSCRGRYLSRCTASTSKGPRMTDPQNPDVPATPPTYNAPPPAASQPAYSSAPPAPYGAPGERAGPRQDARYRRVRRRRSSSA